MHLTTLLKRSVKPITISLASFSSQVFAWGDWQPLKVDKDQLLIPIEVKGKTGWAVIDTGAAISSFNANLAKDMKGVERRKDMTIKEAKGTKRYGHYRDVSIQLNSGDVLFERMGSSHLPSGEMVHLGCDFLQKHHVQIDLKHNRIRFDNIDKSVTKKGEALATMPQDGTCLLNTRVDFGEHKDWLLFDTGAEQTITASNTLAKKAGPSLSTVSVESHAVDASKMSTFESVHPYKGHSNYKGSIRHDAFDDKVITLSYDTGEIFISSES